jgi:hypothetical protein
VGFSGGCRSGVVVVTKESRQTNGATNGCYKSPLREATLVDSTKSQCTGLQYSVTRAAVRVTRAHFNSERDVHGVAESSTDRRKGPHRIVLPAACNGSSLRTGHVELTAADGRLPAAEQHRPRAKRRENTARKARVRAGWQRAQVRQGRSTGRQARREMEKNHEQAQRNRRPSAPHTGNSNTSHTTAQQKHRHNSLRGCRVRIATGNSRIRRRRRVAGPAADHGRIPSGAVERPTAGSGEPTQPTMKDGRCAVST